MTNHAKSMSNDMTPLHLACISRKMVEWTRRKWITPWS
jgi:hypothetical protein